MRLCVHVLEAQDLQVKDSCVEVSTKVKLGKCKARTRMAKPVEGNVHWNEEFIFRVCDMGEKLVVSCFAGDGKAPCVGVVRVPVWVVFDEERHILAPTWFSLQPKGGKSNKAKCYGKVLLTMSVHERGHTEPASRPPLSFGAPANSANMAVASREIIACTNPSQKMMALEKQTPAQEDKQSVQTMAGRFVQRLLNKNEATESSHEPLLASTDQDSSELSNSFSEYESSINDPISGPNFEDMLETLQSREEGQDIPENLQGGVLIDHIYRILPKDMNKLLFEPNSQFAKDIAERQGTTDRQIGAWKWACGENPPLKRELTYIKAASKLIKAVKGFEDQMYLKADGKEFAVLASVSTPDVPYGNCFKIELLYKITPGPELPSGEESSHLFISWNLNFHQSTMMKGMIESGARQGIKEGFEVFADLLAQNVKLVEPSELQVDKNQMLESVQMEHQSDWDLAVRYFWNLTVVSTLLMCLYVTLHILISGPRTIQGLEFNGLDLPDNFGEVFTCAILVLQVERVFNMISRFVQARVQRGSDHGVKAQGDGWLLTVALIEGEKLTSVDSAGHPDQPDPYVVFTCNGKIRTSSVKLQTSNPQWNEILEFDAMEEPPSVLDIEVFDFDGPFDQDGSLGHAEINFLKQTSAEMADMWIPLKGKLAQASQAKVHLRIFLDNNNGVETIKGYLTKMEKEVGNKLNMRSPHRNLVFQKLFGLPPEEFLVKDFSCYLKRKLPLQGRLFLSARIIGFYANLFWNKTKFFFLWEDIDDIQVVPPSLASVGKPSLLIILRKDRGLDARHAAKSQDEDGRLRFHFQSFASFGAANRTIMALWRTKTLSPEQRAQLVEDLQDEDGKYSENEDNGSFVSAEDVDSDMSKIFSADIPVGMTSVMELFNGGTLEQKIMERAGCLCFNANPWESIKPDKWERDVSYRFNLYVSMFGGEVTSTQQKTPARDENGWIISEIMTLHEVPFGDHFKVHLRYNVTASTSVPNMSQCDVYVGIEWIKRTKFKERISKNIFKKFTNRLKEIFELLEKETLLPAPKDAAR
ncbi:C2 and GRAM domain-containing protein At1g03370-like [Aristolochia californica]|uniref:C2 and GRAM domain-containing protein At1g03370-like n=1 Tax=Aristolochia californica TaxID=171875 RepID=UPI0035E05603